MKELAWAWAVINLRLKYLFLFLPHGSRVLLLGSARSHYDEAMTLPLICVRNKVAFISSEQAFITISVFKAQNAMPVDPSNLYFGNFPRSLRFEHDAARSSTLFL